MTTTAAIPIYNTYFSDSVAIFSDFLFDFLFVLKGSYGIKRYSGAQMKCNW